MNAPSDLRLAAEQYLDATSVQAPAVQRLVVAGVEIARDLMRPRSGGTVRAAAEWLADELPSVFERYGAAALWTRNEAQAALLRVAAGTAESLGNDGLSAALAAEGERLAESAAAGQHSGSLLAGHGRVDERLLAQAAEMARSHALDQGDHEAEQVARDWEASIVYTLVALASRDPTLRRGSPRRVVEASPPMPAVGSTETQAEPDIAVNVDPFSFVDALDDLERLENVRAAIETMIGELSALLLRDEDLSVVDVEQAKVIRGALEGLYRMESPPPIASVDGNLTDAARILHRNSPPDPAFDGPINRLLADRASGDADGLSEPMGAVLTEAAKRSHRSKLKDETAAGLWSGYRKLLEKVPAAAATAAVGGLAWLAVDRAWLAAVLRFFSGLMG